MTSSSSPPPASFPDPSCQRFPILAYSTCSLSVDTGRLLRGSRAGAIDVDRIRSDILSRLPADHPQPPASLLDLQLERDVAAAAVASEQRDQAASEARAERAAREKAARQKAESASLAEAMRRQQELYERATAGARRPPSPVPSPKRVEPPKATSSPPIMSPPPAQVTKPDVAAPPVPRRTSLPPADPRSAAIAAAVARARHPEIFVGEKRELLSNMLDMGFSGEAAAEAIEAFGRDDKVFAFASAFQTLSGEMKFPGSALRRPLILFDCDVRRASEYMVRFVALMKRVSASADDVQQALEANNDDIEAAAKYLEAVRDLRNMGFEQSRIHDAIARHGPNGALAHLVGDKP